MFIGFSSRVLRVHRFSGLCAYTARALGVMVFRFFWGVFVWAFGFIPLLGLDRAQRV